MAILPFWTLPGFVFFLRPWTLELVIYRHFDGAGSLELKLWISGLSLLNLLWVLGTKIYFFLSSMIILSVSLFFVSCIYIQIKSNFKFWTQKRRRRAAPTHHCWASHTAEALEFSLVTKEWLERKTNESFCGNLKERNLFRAQNRKDAVLIPRPNFVYSSRDRILPRRKRQLLFPWKSQQIQYHDLQNNIFGFTNS